MFGTNSTQKDGILDRKNIWLIGHRLGIARQSRPTAIFVTFGGYRRGRPMAYWRQWRKPRTKVRNLLKRGVKIQTAVGCGITSKGPWRSSKTPGINQALSNAYLKSEGLYALRDGWIKLHYPE